ncbi:microtubule-associated protein 70-5-like [Lycium barbarum]|uniref:microtubule-associated protein 70-5-like n=1 Tax=Lycium barbarum TaxID=112863 RepID=UPI00293E9261|nr:microtubule-associated protein 70-5-like [Lycium barbarum]
MHVQRQLQLPNTIFQLQFHKLFFQILTKYMSKLLAAMQRLRVKLTISDRTAKAEAQLKDKLKLRLKTLEQGLKQAFNVSVKPNGSPKSQKTKHYLGNNLVKKSLWTSRNKNVESAGKENAEMKENSIVDINSNEITEAHKIKNRGDDQEENKTNGCSFRHVIFYAP